jgi:hypothetical protein
MMDGWKTGKDQRQKIIGFRLYPLFQYSNIPLFQPLRYLADLLKVTAGLNLELVEPFNFPGLN